jgi:diguanylate cyclase
MFKAILSCILMIIVIGSNVSAVAAENVKSENQETYTVGIEDDDVVSRVLFNVASNQLGFNVKFITFTSFNKILNAVENGAVDFAANVTHTKALAKRFDFSRPTNIEYIYLYSVKDIELSHMKRIGIPAGTAFDDLIATQFPEIEQVIYSSINQAADLLNHGEIDGAIDEINQLKTMLSMGFYAKLLNDHLPIKPVSIIAKKDKHSDMVLRLERFAYQTDIQRLLSQSIQKYQFDIRRQALQIRVRDSGINRKKIYKVKLENFGQYAEYRLGGNVRGISADIVFKSCEVLSIICKLESNANEEWASMYDDLLNNRIDILAPTSQSVSRQNSMYFSDSYYHPSAILIKREGYKDGSYHNISELLIERIGVIKDDFFAELIGSLLPNTQLKFYDNQKEQIQGLINREIDYIPLSEANFNQILRNSASRLPVEEDKTIGTFYHNDIAIAFPKTDEGKALSMLFSQAIKMLDVQNIIHTYDSLPDWRATLIAEKRIATKTTLLLLVILVLMIGMVTYLHIQSNTDGLTKLRNRRALYRRFSRGVSSHVAIVYLDVDKFKQINDSYGHDVGDKVLQQLADIINATWKGYRYRIGGDEFILADSISERELSELLPNFEHFVYVDLSKNFSFNVSVSAGVSINRLEHQSLEDVMHLADVEMYRAKYRSRAEGAKSRGDNGEVETVSRMFGK